MVSLSRRDSSSGSPKLEITGLDLVTSSVDLWPVIELAAFSDAPWQRGTCRALFVHFGTNMGSCVPCPELVVVLPLLTQEPL
jgi:hypothetical protein